MSTFPYFLRPSPIVCLDDDLDFLNLLSLIMPKQWDIRLHSDAANWLSYLVRITEGWEADSWTQQQVILGSREGQNLIPAILQYWSEHPERYDLARLAVVDYAMPNMTGLQALAKIPKWRGARLLLTGVADEAAAVTAFNQNLIDQFIPKQKADAHVMVIRAVEDALDASDERLHQLWAQTLNQDQSQLLIQDATQTFLHQFAKKHWVEYMVIGQPFGILGLDIHGKPSWLQLEMREGLRDFAILLESQGLEKSVVEAVRKGRSLVNLELRQSLANTIPIESADAFVIGDSHSALLGALFTFALEKQVPSIPSYLSWLLNHPRLTPQAVL